MRFAVLGLLGVLAGVGIVVATIVVYSKDLPSITELGNYRPPTVTLVEDRNGKVLGEIYEKRRYVVPYEAFPQNLKDAFIAAEDAAFWEHSGVDPVGIVRAALRNIQAGGFAQGASTITQQVAKNFLLTNEKKLERKIREMILATRIEDAFDKEHILYLYLNEIYLGSGSYGVESAARIYFDKHVEELTLAESAVLAGLPQRPSDYSPHKHWEKARFRQKYVLDQMLKKGFIDVAERDQALAEQVKVTRKPNPTRILAPSFTEHVRRHLVSTYGQERVYNEGLVVRTTCDLELQQHAQDVLVQGVTRMDNSIGWRGPKRQLEDMSQSLSEFRQEAETKLIERQHRENDAARRSENRPSRSALVEGKRYESVILEVTKKHAVAAVGSHEVMIPLSWTKWAYKPNPNRSWRRRALTDMTEPLAIGDIVDVVIENLDAQDAKPLKGYRAAQDRELAAAKLYQSPDLQGALLSFDLETGAVRSMVGGIDIERSEFNRAVQAQRQVGSTFKPIVYATAIETKKFTAGSMLLDAPLTYNTLGARLWKPGNYGEEYLGNITLRKGLAMSRNVCTVRVLDILGTEDVYDMARRLGINSPMEKDLAMGLGAASLTMVEMARAYSVFASGGKRIEPFWIESVTDRDGKLLEQHKAPTQEQVVTPEVAYVMTWLLNQVARHGTGASTNQLGVTLAGKTGTTNDYKDGWFMGYSPGIVTGVWVGYDQPRSMGVSSTGGRTALPIWIEYMRQAWPKSMDRPFSEPQVIDWAEIDESNGRVARGGRRMPFIRGTVPVGVAIDLGQKSTLDLMTEDF
jgi:penicillin-binding protein 1A